MPDSPVPPDDGRRPLRAVDPDADGLRRLAVVGDSYTVLVSGEDTGGALALIDMLIPPGGGPPPHRHHFEEMFHVLEGELEVTFRGETTVARTGHTVEIPADAPHAFHNTSDRPARVLCTVVPAGLEAYFAEFGDPLPTRTSPAPELTEDELGARMAVAQAKAAQYGIENLPPD